jgi:hypothetical protein
VIAWGRKSRKEAPTYQHVIDIGRSGTIMAGEDYDTGIKIYLREIGQIPLLTP